MLTFYEEWMKLGKDQFRILAMLVDLDGFEGDLAKVWSYFSPSKLASKTKEKLKATISELAEGGFISCSEKKGNYSISIIEKEKKLTIPRKWFDKIVNFKCKGASVAWQIILKTAIWLYNYYQSGEVIRRESIAEPIKASVKQISSSTSALQNELHLISKHIIQEKYELYDEEIEYNNEDTFNTKGIEYTIPSLWGEPCPPSYKKPKEK